MVTQDNLVCRQVDRKKQKKEERNTNKQTHINKAFSLSACYESMSESVSNKVRPCVCAVFRTQ